MSHIPAENLPEYRRAREAKNALDNYHNFYFETATQSPRWLRDAMTDIQNHMAGLSTELTP